MKPLRFSPAHRSPLLAELVCSNSLRSDSLENAAGLLKEEMRQMDSLVMRAADASRVPAGTALAVDREIFSRAITRKLEEAQGIETVREEVATIPKDIPVIIATGPLTSDLLAQSVAGLTGQDSLYFHDATSPIVEADTIDYGVVFKANRYGKGEGAYLNCSLTKEQYHHFVRELLKGERAPVRDFEKETVFEGCMPIEVMASRGMETLAHGPMRPVGLVNPRTGKKPYAVVQLRQENRQATLYDLVGFQTKLKWSEQKRIFGLIPGLEKAGFARFGNFHRNTYINSPTLLEQTLQFRKDPLIFFAGQITGVEGYIESTAMGLVAGIQASRFIRGKRFYPPPPATAMGALINYITTRPSSGFQPMNINFGLLPPLEKSVRKKDRRRVLVARALQGVAQWKSEMERP
jgi:methylenetetrahydrofolate--tRNA-(uracil-5-)-methyltransferase